MKFLHPISSGMFWGYKYTLKIEFSIVAMSREAFNANYSSLEYVFIRGTCETQVNNEISLSKNIGIIVFAKHTFVIETETNGTKQLFEV